MDLDSNLLPDHDIEQFWIMYKRSMYNFYSKCSEIKRPIELWCSNLNGLQLIRQYDEIEENIYNYISLYAIDLMRMNDIYHTNILVSNIKRWNKLSKEYKISERHNKYHNIVFVLLDIFQSVSSDIDTRDIFSQIELLLLYKDFRELIRVSIENKKVGILEKLLNYDKDIYKQVEKLYNLGAGTLYNLSAKKIINSYYI